MTCSVMVCSTWMRGLHSMKKCSPVSGFTRNSTVPAFSYFAARASFTASARMRWRRPSSRLGAGATSTTFWLRSCTEQSRSNRCTTLPWPSPSTWTSMCRGRGTIFSRKRARSPNAASASPWQRAKASSISSGLVTARMPRPPPPAEAFSITG